VTLLEAGVAATDGRARRRPVVPVVVEFGTPLAHAPTAATVDELKGLVGAELAIMIERLGIDGEPSVAVSVVESRRPLRVSVHGCFQPYEPALARRAWLATAPASMHDLSAAAPATPEDGFPNAWLDALAGREADRGLVLAFAARLVRAVVLQSPSCLLGREQVVRYARRAGLEVDDVAPVLCDLLDLGVCVSDHSIVRDIVLEGRELGRAPEDTVEAAFAVMRSHVVELLVHPATLRRLLGVDGTDDRFSVYSSQVDPFLRELFRGVELRFFEEFGFLLPRFDWVASQSMPEGMLSVTIGTWSSLPVPLVMPGERLVLPADEDVLRKVAPPEAKRTTLHPMNGAPCTIMTGTKAAFDEQGITTWGPIDFVVLNLFAELASHPGRVLGMEEI
jgi:hypothetical protein